MSLAFQGFERALDGVGHARFFHHQRAAHVDDRGNVLNEDGTGFDAGAAGAAGPERFVADHCVVVGSEHRRGVLEAEVELVAAHQIGDLLLADGGGVGLEVLDDVHRRERLAGDISGTVVGAATTANADVELEELLHAEVFELGDAEVFLLLDVLDQVEFAGGGGALEEGVSGGEDEVVELGVAKQCDPAKRGDHVEPPERAVHVEGGVDAHTGEDLGDDPAAGRPVGPLGIDVNLGGVNAQTFDQEAADQKDTESADDQPVFPGRQPGGARPRPAMPDRHAHAHQSDDAEDVGDERIAEIAGPDEDVDGDVVVDRQQGGDEEEDDHGGHDADVHDARVAVAEDALGTGPAAQHAEDAGGQVVEGELGLAESPHARAPHESVDDDADHEGQEQVERPEVVDIEEEFAVRAGHADGFGAGDEQQPAERQPGRNGESTDALASGGRGPTRPSPQFGCLHHVPLPSASAGIIARG